MILPIANRIKPRTSMWKVDFEETDDSNMLLKQVQSVGIQTDDPSTEETVAWMTDSGFSEIFPKKSPNKISYSEYWRSSQISERTANDTKQLMKRLRSRIECLKLRNKSAMCYFMTERLRRLHSELVRVK